MDCKMIQESIFEDVVYQCSNCKGEFVDEIGYHEDWNYCSYCGAKITEFVPYKWDDEEEELEGKA